MEGITDNALMHKVKSGDLDKLGLLYERHKGKLFGFFYNMYHNAALSEDLVQNVFIRVLRYKHTYRGEGSFTAWIFKMARNIGYEHYKKSQKTGNTNEYSSVEYKLPSTDNIDEEFDFNDDVSIMYRALNRLSPERREILILSKIKEIRFAEVGEILGCSEGAAKVKAHRALKDLRTVFLELNKV